MADPAVTNLTQLDPSDTASWTSAVVGNADDDIPDLGVTIEGINPPNTCVNFESSSSSYINGQKYSAYSPSWTAIDLSSADSAVLVHFAGNPGQFNQVSGDSDGITMYAFNSDRANYAYWEIGGSGDTFYKGAATFFPLLLRDADRTGTGGTWDNTSVVEIGVAFKAGGDGQFGISFRIDQIIQVNGEVVLSEGDLSTVGTFKEYRDLLFSNASTGDFYNAANAYIPPAYGFGYPIRINSTNFSDSNSSFIFLPNDPEAGFTVPTTGYYSLTIDPDVVTATLDFSDIVFAYSTGTYPLVVDGSSLTSGTLDFTRTSFLNTSSVVVEGSQTTMTNCSLPGPSSVSLSGATLINMSIDDCAQPVEIDGDLGSGSSIQITNPQSDSLQFNIDVGDYSDIDFTVPSGGIVNVDPTTDSGTYNLSGISSTGTVEFDNLSSNDTTIVIPSSLSNTVTSPTTGGGSITIDNAVTVDVTVTAIDVQTGLGVPSARVRLEASSGGVETEGTVILQGLTDSSGVLTSSYTFTGSQPVTGTVRKSGADPYYKPGSLSGTITSTGYNVPVTLVRD